MIFLEGSIDTWAALEKVIGMEVRGGDILLVPRTGGLFLAEDATREIRDKDSLEAVEDYREGMEKVRRSLKEAGVDADSLRARAEKNATEVAKRFGRLTKRRGDGDFVEAVSTAVAKTFQEVRAEDVPLAVSLTAFCLVMNTTAYVLLLLAFGDPAALVITAVAVAPFVEEMAKRAAMDQGISGTFFIVFNVAETSLYVHRITSAGAKLGTALAVRAFPVLMHLATTVVQRHYREERGPGKDEAGYFAAVLIHAGWNAMAATSLV